MILLISMYKNNINMHLIPLKDNFHYLVHLSKFPIGKKILELLKLTIKKNKYNS